MAAVIAVRESRASRRYQRDLTEARRMIEDIQRRVQQGQRVQPDTVPQWKMFTELGRLALDAYKAGVFDVDEDDEDDYE